MKMLITLMLLVASCTSPEEATIEAGGMGRVLCMRPDDRGFIHCRDAQRLLFVCVHVLNSKCVSVLRVMDAWQ